MLASSDLKTEVNPQHRTLMKKPNSPWLSAVSFVILLTSTLLILAKHSEEKMEARTLCFDQMPLVIAHRHIKILRELPERPLRDDMFPVHILYRETTANKWSVVGTGTYLQNFNPSLISAYHVFSGRSGEFGYRKMNRSIFTNKEPVLPIVKIEDPLADDTILCTVGAKNDFTSISVPKKEIWNPGRSELTFRGANGSVRLLTRPQISHRLLCWTEIKPGIRYIIFDRQVVAGESGTGGIVDTTGRNSLFVVLQNVSAMTFGSPAKVRRRLGMGVIIEFGITPPK